MFMSSIKSNIKKADIINLIAVSIVSLICIIIFVTVWISLNSSSSEIAIFDLKQSGSTDNSVLISWDCSQTPDRYLVKYTLDDETKYIESNLPFARIGDLKPEQELDVEVLPIKDGVSYTSQTIKCVAQSRCSVKNISAQFIDNSINVSWSFEGKDAGFEVVAYVKDINGYRHFTSEIINIDSGEPSECTIDNIIPGMNYTVAVVPKFKYFSTEKLTVTGSEYSKSYSNFKILRCAVCPENQANSKNVTVLKSITSGRSYVVSIIFSGLATSNSTSSFCIYFIDSSGNLVKELKSPNVKTNNNKLKPFKQTSIILGFTADMPADAYTALLCIDDQPAYKMSFKVTDK